MNKNILFVWFFFFVIFALYVFPQQEEVENGENILTQIKNLSGDFKEKSLAEVLKNLSEQTKINIIGSPDVEEERISLSYKNLNLKEILDLIVARTDTAYRVESKNLIKFWKLPKITMEFKDAPLDTVASLIAKQAGKSIVISPEVLSKQVKVTASFHHIPWDTALENITKTIGVVLVAESDKIIRIVTKNQLETQMETRVFHLKYIRPKTYIQPVMKTEYAKTEPPGKSSSDDKGSSLAQLTLIYAIQDMLTKDTSGKLIGSIRYDELNNTLIVKDIKPVLDEIERVIKKYDVEPSQVLIDVHFVTTSDEELFRIGINYASGKNAGWTFTTLPPTLPTGATTYETTSQQPELGTIPFGFGQLKFASYIGAKDEPLTATLRLFRQNANSKVIQAPTILALDNYEATIFVGDTIRWAQSTAASSQSGGIVYSISEASGSPVNVGFQLLVIPHIIKDKNKVMLTIIPQNSYLIGKDPDLPGFDKYEIGSGGANPLSIYLPRLRSSALVTSMIVEDNQTAVIGGLISTTESKTLSSIPFFGSIPIIGELFKHRDKSETSSHLIIYITPRIVKASETIIKEQAELNKTRRNNLKNEYKNLQQGKKKSNKDMDTYMEERKKEIIEEYKQIKELKK